MAFSQSIRKAQTPKLCDLCEKDININWKCLQCNTFMCNTCKNIHLKVQTSIQHEIVNIKTHGDVGGHPAIRTDNIPCHIHAKKLHCMFCWDCDTLVCPDCISKSHKKHELESLDQACQEMKETLISSKYHTATKLAFCEFETEKLHIAEATRHSMYSEAVEKIAKREKELKDAISKYAHELRLTIEKEKEYGTITLSKTEKCIKRTENSLRDKQNQIQTAIDSNQAGLIFTAVSECRENIPDLSFNTVSNTILDFCRGEQSEEYIGNLFGIVKAIPLPEENCHFAFELQKSFATDLKTVLNLLLLYNERAWISNFNTEVLRQVEIENKMKITKEISTAVVDITATPRNEVLLTLKDSSDVMQVNTIGEMKHFLSVSPLLGKGIHVTEEHDIILGVREKGDPDIVTKKSCRKIIIFGRNRQLKCSYEYDQNNQRLFTVPYRITTNVNNDIVVIDSTSEHTGRLVVLGKEGDLKWVYEGHPTINTGENLFDPCDVVTSQVGHIFVPDCKNHALHVLSGDGDVLMCKIMKDQGIIFPLSLDIDSRGQLWVGCGTSKGEKDAKIHVLKLY